MALRFDWSQITSRTAESLVIGAINAVISQNNGPLQGGFAYVESLELGSSPPVFALTDITHLSDDGTSAEAKLHFSYSGEARVVARVYAQINTTRSQRGRAGDRARLLFRSLDSFAPAYLNVWACVSHVDISADATLTLIPSPSPAIRIRFASFPLRHVSLATCFDGSVISDTISAGIGGAVAAAKAEFAARGLAIEVPLGSLPPAEGPESAATVASTGATDGKPGEADHATSSRAGANQEGGRVPAGVADAEVAGATEGHGGSHTSSARSSSSGGSGGEGYPPSPPLSVASTSTSAAPSLAASAPPVAFAR